MSVVTRLVPPLPMSRGCAFPIRGAAPEPCPAASPCAAPDGDFSLNRNQILCFPGEPGEAFRVREGVLRLDLPRGAGDWQFAALAVAGDLVCAEALAGETGQHRITALTPARLQPVSAAEFSSARDWLAELSRRAQRHAQTIALAHGSALERTGRLLRLLQAGFAEPAGRLALPRRVDVAALTALTVETVSRTIAALRRAGVLVPCVLPGVPRDSGFLAQPLALASLIEGAGPTGFPLSLEAGGEPVSVSCP